VWPMAVCAAAWVLVLASLSAAVVFNDRLHDLGRPDLTWGAVVIGVYVAAIASAGLVGSALLVRRRGHPVGWAFLALAVSLAIMAGLDLYARVGVVARPGSLPGAAAIAHLLDPLFLAFFASAALVLYLTPTGQPLSRRWGWAATSTIVAAVVGYAAGVMSGQPIDPPYDAVPNPLEVPLLSGVLGAIRDTAAMLTAIGLVAGAASLAVRYRRARGDDRLQLLWMVLAAAPLPLYVAVAFLFRNSDNEAPLLLATAGWIVVIPVATGLSITRYHLFEVERILSRTITYALLTVLVVATYAAVVILAGEALTGMAGSSTVAAVLATLAAISVVAPARRFLQDALDRRFNRRRFDAMRLVDRHLHDSIAGSSIEDVLREALGDPTLRVAYWVEDRRQWVSGDGRPTRPADHAVDVWRADAPVARVSFDESRVSRQVAEPVAALALPELDNARLRAAIALQLVEVHESRARIAAAQLAERRRIERNLHDGAQQRLLALGFELQAAQLSGDSDRLVAAVTIALDQTGAALTELRDLANGLHPAVLSDGGLVAALDDLSNRSPGVLEVRCTEARFSPDIETAAWFVICEAVTNAFKHASPSVVSVDVDDHVQGLLVVSVCDDGRGGADPTGTGIQGLRDRADAAGGRLQLESDVSQGTTVRVELPCVQ